MVKCKFYYLYTEEMGKIGVYLHDDLVWAVSCIKSGLLSEKPGGLWVTMSKVGIKVVAQVA